MEPVADCPLATVLAQRLREARTDLTSRWLERISERVALAPGRVFPSDDLLDHMPLLIDGIADSISRPPHAVQTDSSAVDRARELGALRYAQGFDEYEILKEFEIFGGILFSFFARTVDEIEEPCTRRELAACCQRLFQAVTVVEQATAVQFHQLMRARVAEREQRLRLFNRALSHELRNQIGAALGAGEILMVTDGTDADRRRLAEIVVRNLSAMRVVLDNLVELTRVGETDVRQQRHVRLPEAASEAIRSLREAAQAATVEVRVSGALPDVEISAAAVELCLTNLLTNAIKYAHPDQSRRWVEVSGEMQTPDDGASGQVVISVRDNGLGVPEADRSRLFERLFRARSEQSERIRGTGMGLSIVRETAEALGGHAWAEFPVEGSMFAFSLPCRRAADGAAERRPRAGARSPLGERGEQGDR
jgi:signal transduction histidine kinase